MPVDTPISDATVHDLKVPGLSADLRMYVYANNDAYISRSIAEEGIWEEQETQILLDYLKPGQIFVDVGANIGYFTLLASKLVGHEGSVLAFEPESDNFRLLEHNCQLNKTDNVLCVNAALGKDETQATLYLSEENKGDHSICPGDDRQQQQEIRIVNGSDFALARYKKADFIKIDTQGYENQVLQGLLGLIQASLPDLIMIVEFSPISLKNAGSSGVELLDQFGGFGPHYLYIPDPHSNRLLPIANNELKMLCAMAERNPEKEWFTNLVLSGHPVGSLSEKNSSVNLGIFDNTLNYLLLSKELQPWNGEMCNAQRIKKYLYLPEGWYFAEPWGRWSIGKLSRIKFYPEQSLKDMTSPVLRIKGRYFEAPELTGVYLDDAHLGNFDLRDGDIPVPPNSFQKDYVCLELTHTSPHKSSGNDSEKEKREIKFGLEEISIVST